MRKTLATGRRTAVVQHHTHTVVARRRHSDGRVVPAAAESAQAARSYFEATTPWHEAAHQVVGTALGYPASLLTLASSSVGCANAPARDRALIAAAGIAQSAFFGAPGVRPSGPAALATVIASADGGDWTSLLRFVPDEAGALAAIANARELLEKLQPYVLVLGQALAERGRLEGSEIAAILNSETARLKALPGAVALDAASDFRQQQ